MKIVEINGANYASTGHIMLDIAKLARKEGIEVFTCAKDSKKSRQFSYENQIYIGSRVERVISEQLVKLTGKQNFYNYFGTKSFINKLKEIKPDLIHLHIIHDTYMNLGMLFDYIKENNIPVIWTFHDCWAFTGRCPYFDITGCDKWKTGCGQCPYAKNLYPETDVDKTDFLWNLKKEWFTGLKNCAIVTPSKWLSQFIPDSFLKEYPVQVINNGIDLNKFKPIDSDFRKQYHLEDKKIVLGVGYGWSPRKGLDTFIELSKSLPEDYQIVLVGTNDTIDQQLPSNIISIHRTYNQEELIKIYSACDVFVNPTKEDNFPTVNMEALACGLPVITYKTGGSPEIIDKTCGSVVEKGDIDSLEKEIIRVCGTKPYSKQACIKRSKDFDANKKLQEYVELYKKILKK